MPFLFCLKGSGNLARRRNDDIADILLELNKDLTRIADNKLSKEVKQVYGEEVEYMYGEWSPTSYERRYDDGGFADERNWNIEVKPTNNGIELELTNEAEAVNSNMRLDKIIEEGVYDWSSHPEERPVYNRTEMRISDERVVENILESELKKLGYKFK